MARKAKAEAAPVKKLAEKPAAEAAKPAAPRVNSFGIDEADRPEFAGTTQEQDGKDGVWFVRYDEKGRMNGSWKKV